MNIITNRRFELLIKMNYGLTPVNLVNLAGMAWFISQIHAVYGVHSQLLGHMTVTCQSYVSQSHMRCFESTFLAF